LVLKPVDGRFAGLSLKTRRGWFGGLSLKTTGGRFLGLDLKTRLRFRRIGGGTWRHREDCVEAKRSCEGRVAVGCFYLELDHNVYKSSGSAQNI
jgi:hypothetical protein